MESKPFWKSKTFWINIIGLVVVVLEYIGTIDLVNPEILASILAVLNLFLRLNGAQSKPLTLK